MKKLKLHGFNNLTKSLSFCIYDICYAKTAEERDGYIAYIDELYNANRLTEILSLRWLSMASSCCKKQTPYCATKIPPGFRQRLQPA
ncbi:hypothetical protein BED12_23025 [Escherichia coli]|nr:hypothetical protein [Escherichia coli]